METPIEPAEKMTATSWPNQQLREVDADLTPETDQPDNPHLSSAFA